MLQVQGIRICLYNCHERPIYCEACTNATLCQNHCTVTYGGTECDKKFYRSCLCNYDHIHDIDCIAKYNCIECDTGKRAQRVDTKESNISKQGSLSTKLRQIGVNLSPGANNSDNRKATIVYKK